MTTAPAASAAHYARGLTPDALLFAYYRGVNEPVDDTRYWYGTSAEDKRARAVEVLQAFRLYRAAEQAMRRRTRESMSMGENDLLVLRYLLKAKGEGRLVSPTELTKYLGVSTASTTAMIDRLEKSGHVSRERHPTDRRSIHVIASEASDDEVRATLGKMHARMLAAVIDMTPEETATIVSCLHRLQEAVDEVDPHEAPVAAEPTSTRG